MDLDDVRIFTKVAEAGSFTQAAKQLDIPKSTVSRRVAELEDKLDVRLLQRSTRKLTLTHAGELYFQRTSRAIEELQQAERALEEMQSEPRGVLRVTAPSDLSGLIPKMIQDFQVAYPLVDVIVFATGRRVDLIAEGYDIALRAGPRTDSSMMSRKLLEASLGFFASPDYVKNKGKPQSLDELSDHNCLCFGTEKTENTWTLHRGSVTREVTVRGSIASNDFSLLLGACVQGMGIAVLPVFEPNRLVRAGQLVRLFEDWTSDKSGLYAVYPSPRHLSPKVRAFIDFAANWLAQCDNVQGEDCKTLA